MSKFKIFVTLVTFQLLVILSGCDGSGDDRGSSSNTVVTSSNSDAELTTYATSTFNTTVKSTTKILSTDTINNIEEMYSDGDTIIFSKANDQIYSFAIGNVIACGISTNTPYGLLRKITSIQNEGGKVIIETDQAVLTDAISNGTFNVVVSSKPVASQYTNQLQKIILSDILVDLPSFDKEISTTIDNVTLTGNITLEPKLFIQGDIQGAKLSSFQFVTIVDETTKLTISTTVSANINKERTIFTKLLPPIEVYVGIPIVIIPTLSIIVGVDGSISAGISGGAQQNAQYKAGLKYENGQWSKVKEYNDDYDISKPIFQANANIKFYAGPKIETSVYDVAGPYATLYGYMRLNANPSVTPWWNLYGGVEATAGIMIKVPVFFDTITIADYSAQVFDYSKLIASADIANSDNNQPAPLPPMIAQKPLSTKPDTVIKQWGSGFIPNGTATLHFLKPDNTEYPTQSQKIDSDGAFNISYAVPSTKLPGTYTWWAVDDTNGNTSNQVSYDITSAIDGTWVATQKITSSDCTNRNEGSKFTVTMEFKQNGQSVTFGIADGVEEYHGTLNGYDLDSSDNFSFSGEEYKTTTHVTYSPEFKKATGKYQRIGKNGNCSFSADITAKKK